MEAVVKTIARIFVAYFLAFLCSIPLSYVVVGLGGNFGYSNWALTMPLLWLAAYWLLGRHRHFRKQ
jgi:hypothetical protein